MADIYHIPRLEEADLRVLALLDEQKQALRPFTQNEPRRWWGVLRRTGVARAVRASNSIEGFEASLNEVDAIEKGAPSPSEERLETWQAVRGYQRAMTHLIQTAQDGVVGFDTQFLKSVHFIMMEHDLDKKPGAWRDRTIHVVEKNQEPVYEAPAAEHIGQLMQLFIETLCRPDFQTAPLSVRAAMAHLNLVMIHPFKDGNGRMARAVQTFVLAREDTAHPIFSSIEEWLGDNTEAYYQILAKMSNGAWSPEVNALPWVRFCLTGHYQQMQTMLRRMDHYGKLLDEIEKAITDKGLPKRCDIALLNSALGYRMTRRRYEADAEVSLAIAARDLQALAAAGLLAAQGEKRGRYYVAGDRLRTLYQLTRPPRQMDDPYQIAADLPLLPQT